MIFIASLKNFYKSTTEELMSKDIIETHYFGKKYKVGLKYTYTLWTEGLECTYSMWTDVLEYT